MAPRRPRFRAGDYTRAVLILPPGHGQTIAARQRLSRRERWLLRSVGALTAAIVLLVVLALVQSSAARRGCVEITIASSLGGQPLSGCGSHARAICAGAGSEGYSGSAREAVRSACARAGLPVGRPRGGSPGR
jgi:hypothetical protein